ncbi:MAG: VWA domain-containing protein [Burkholderiaceae bacterium]|nr:VWA domain-containing protein [Burkholderiaceae bacterium]
MTGPRNPAARGREVRGARRQRGQIVILVGLTLVVLVGIVGLALDSGRGYGVKAKLNAAVDAGSIAAARAIAVGTSDSERIANAQAAAQRYFDLNFPADYQGAVRPIPTMQALRDPISRRWTVTVSASAAMPTTFARVLGRTELDVFATGTAVRRQLDVMMVLDTSGSLEPPTSPAGTFDALKAAAVNGFVNKFSPDDDRIGLVSFSSGAVIDLPIRKAPPPADARGFNKTALVNAVNALTAAGATASAEGVRRAVDELDAIPAGLRSDLRVILFFSDGAPNIVSGTFPRQGGGNLTGNLYSEADANGQPASYWIGQICNSYGTRPCRVWDENTRNTYDGLYNLTGLPANGQGGIPLASYRASRTLTAGAPAHANSLCNVNKAARNMVENIANTGRGAAAPIYVYSIGLGARLNSNELASDCGYGPSEYGSNILKRLANTGDSDTYNAAQPKGLYCFAATAADLDRCFSAIASEVLRLAI